MMLVFVSSATRVAAPEKRAATAPGGEGLAADFAVALYKP